MGRTRWVATTHKAAPWATQNWRPEGRWKSRAVEKSKSRLSHRAWKSRKVRGIPTFPPPRRLLVNFVKPDISLATESGHFHLLTTAVRRIDEGDRDSALTPQGQAQFGRNGDYMIPPI